MANPLTLFNRNRRALAREDGESVDPFFRLQHEMNRLFDDAFASFGSSFSLRPVFEGAFSPRADLRETDDALELDFELPGVAEEDLDIQLADNVLTVRGEKKQEVNDERKGYRHVERSYGSFARSIPLPYEIDPDGVDARFRNGVLSLRLPNPPEAARRSKRIEIKRS